MTTKELCSSHTSLFKEHFIVYLNWRKERGTKTRWTIQYHGLQSGKIFSNVFFFFTLYTNKLRWALRLPSLIGGPHRAWWPIQKALDIRLRMLGTHWSEWPRDVCIYRVYSVNDVIDVWCFALTSSSINLLWKTLVPSLRCMALKQVSQGN